jgi:hypothetical protein
LKTRTQVRILVFQLQLNSSKEGNRAPSEPQPKYLTKVQTTSKSVSTNDIRCHLIIKSVRMELLTGSMPMTIEIYEHMIKEMQEHSIRNE